MNDLKALIYEYLSECRMLQVATAIDNQPWCCTVYFAHDNDLNIYWLSKPFRRHSEEISQNNKVAGVVVKHHNAGEKVRGVQIQGTAITISKDSPEFAEKFSYYRNKFSVSDERLEKIKSGQDQHELYMISPDQIVLFDEVNFPDDPRQELLLK